MHSFTVRQPPQQPHILCMGKYALTRQICILVYLFVIVQPHTDDVLLFGWHKDRECVGGATHSTANGVNG